MNCKYPFFIEKNIDWSSVYNAYYQQTRNIGDNDLKIVFQKIINLLEDRHCRIETDDFLISYNFESDTIDKFCHGFVDYMTIPSKTRINADSSFYLYQFRDNIVCLIYNSFEYPIVDVNEFRNMISGFSFSSGIIFDVRANKGGQTQNIGEWVSCFFDGNRTIWHNKHKVGCEHNDFTDFIPQQAVGKGIIPDNIPIVVLTSGYTYSAANYFSSFMKTLPNVKLIGTKTGGGGSWTTRSILPNGWKFSHPVAKAYDIDKQNMLEFGIEPDINVVAAAEWHANPYDIVLETAFNYLISR